VAGEMHVADAMMQGSSTSHRSLVTSHIPPRDPQLENNKRLLGTKI